MIWSSQDALRFRPALGPEGTSKWADIANQVLANGGSTATSSRIANTSARETIMRRLKEHRIRMNQGVS